MGTPFSNIYNRFIIKVKDSELRFEEAILTEQNLFNMLNSAIAQFDLSCPKDLTSYSGISHGEDVFVGDGSNTSFAFSSVPLADSFYIVKVDKTMSNDYSYDTVANSIVFNNAPTGSVFIQWIFGGAFNDTLHDIEEEFLSRYMMLQWLSKQINNACQLRNRLTSDGWKRFSEANNLRAKEQLRTSMKQDLKLDRVAYTYNIKSYNVGEYYE